MKHIIIGTAGHVDHGKSSLIEALTGLHPDRLPEERERGMTIDIGFAALKLPNGQIAGVVDVPGHERFIRNMLAGATGIDVALLVVAADESVMPQTAEHLEILDLLEISNGVVAITKADLVEEEWADEVEADIRLHIAETRLSGAPIVRVSVRTGRGLEQLRQQLMAAASRAAERDLRLGPRLPVDRVFTMAGFGTVVTGTLASGLLRAGDTVEIAPRGFTARIRGIQVHGSKVNVAEAGTRTAVNLAGIDPSAVERGFQLCVPGAIPAARQLDLVLRWLPSQRHRLRDGMRVRLHTGAAESLGRLRVGNAMAPIGPVFARFRSDRALACLRGDLVIIRAGSPSATLAGGRVADPQPKANRLSVRRQLEALQAREEAPGAAMGAALLSQEEFGLSHAEFASRMGLSATDAVAMEQTLFERGDALALANWGIAHTKQSDRLTARAVAWLGEYHRTNPLRAGAQREEFRAALSRRVESKLFAALIAFWSSAGVLETDGPLVRIAGFRLVLSERQTELLQRIEAIYRDSGVVTPAMDEVAANVKAHRDAVQALVAAGVSLGRFAPIGDGLYYLTETLDTIKVAVRDEVLRNGSVTVGRFRDRFATNRKFALQALEYLDEIGFTQRQGDERILAGK
ncbi:MAG: selenocysteine-specific translation elongation factor [Armatimonadetes bacterium]|nr:selenocysteine-specific translation elongation factor [Armatimonadota bacterium]MDE2205420.1 selenocysteine-specific translation elongation factor [Armatimonadota bacterium]